MLRIRNILFGLAALSVTACGPFDAVTRSAPYETLMPIGEMNNVVATSYEDAPEVVTRAVVDIPPVAIPTDFNVIDVRVDVPRTLRVSEANTLIPLGDIVWQGDLPGDRYVQVQAILQEAALQGAEASNGTRDVVVHLTVTRFHSLSHRARYSVGGNHSIVFDLAIVDANTGQQIGETKRVNASLDAFGGQAAIQADLAGLTQKVRIIDHVSRVIAGELDGAQNSLTLASAEF